MQNAKREPLLGYVAHYLSPQRAYYGGVLVTNAKGVPREFRHSEAVRPTKFQEALYGDSLESSLGSDALGPALCDALVLKPDVLLVDAESRQVFGSFLDAHPPAALLVSYDDPEKAFADTISPDGNLLGARELHLKAQAKHRLFAYIEEGESGGAGHRARAAAQQKMNLLSPFQRIRMVLAQVAEAEQGRKKG